MNQNTIFCRDRKHIEKFEQQLLSPFAAQSRIWQSSRLYQEDEHQYRTAFQRDRDRIIHSRAFRRLKHKRQVFVITYGDHYRTRLTHTLEVSQLSRTLARSLGLNEDLAEAIALGHDLGHTPFGHIGEVVLHDVMTGRDDLDGVLNSGDLGGFKHNYQSLRIVDDIEKKYAYPGLNLTAAVREGILKHTRLRRHDLNFPNARLDNLHYELDYATTLEGQIVAISDEIAQRTHDLEDGIRAGHVTTQDVSTLAIVQKVMQAEHPVYNAADELNYRNALIRGLVDFLVSDVILASLERMQKFYDIHQRTKYFDTLIIWFSDAIHPLQQELDEFIMSEIIKKASYYERNERASHTIRDLFKVFYTYPNVLPLYILRRFAEEQVIQQAASDDEFIRAEHINSLKSHPDFARTVCDYISGMTDNFAERAAQYLSTAPRNQLESIRSTNNDWER